MRNVKVSFSAEPMTLTFWKDGRGSCDLVSWGLRRRSSGTGRPAVVVVDEVNDLAGEVIDRVELATAQRPSIEDGKNRSTC